MQIPLEVSARHLHLSEEDLEALFGKGYELKVLKNLSQKGLFAAQEQVILSGPEGSIERVRVVGPVRPKTQIEVSLTDARLLGLKPPLRVSGDLKGSDSIILIGPQGEIELSEGVIIPKRHIHISEAEAKECNLKDGDLLSVKVAGPRGLIFHNVSVRVHPDFVMSLHLDTDEANAAGIGRENAVGEVLK